MTSCLKIEAIFDLYCIGTNGERFIVEMQKAKQDYFKERSVFYATFPIQEQALRGDWDFKLTEIYTVGILDFVKFHQIDMIIVEPKKHSIFHALFYPSITNELAFKSPVPVLTIHS